MMYQYPIRPKPTRSKKNSLTAPTNEPTPAYAWKSKSTGRFWNGRSGTNLEMVSLGDHHLIHFFPNMKKASTSFNSFITRSAASIIEKNIPMDWELVPVTIYRKIDVNQSPVVDTVSDKKLRNTIRANLIKAHLVSSSAHDLFLTICENNLNFKYIALVDGHKNLRKTMMESCLDPSSWRVRINALALEDDETLIMAKMLFGIKRVIDVQQMGLVGGG